MLNTENQEKTRPPRLVPTLVEGFNAIASHIYLILFPIGFDLLLWFGPLVRVKNVLMPLMIQAAELSGAAYGDQGTELIENTNELWSQVLESFNLNFSLRTFPIGIPSLMISQAPQRNPMGVLRIIEMGSLNSALTLVVLFSLGGIILGSLYFALVARAASKEAVTLSAANLLRITGQSLLLSLLLMMALMVFGFPAMCLISSVMLFLPALGALPFMALGLVLVWVLLPLAFSPHGIFLGGMKASQSIVYSVRLVRSLMTVASLFLMMVILLGYGMDALWSTPGVENWMLLVGIFGHSFIASGLLASTFVFYREGGKWLAKIGKEKQAVAH